ncbi:PfkB family carbohydrate kinase [bacterium]
MSLLIVGSAAFDSIETPFGKVDKVVGGSSIYSSVAASFFHDVNLVSVVGKDFPQEEIKFLNLKGINTNGLTISDGDTFFWEGSYSYDLNDAKTIATHLNVFESFNPNLPDEYKTSEYVFLANIDPDLQMHVLDQIEKPKITAMDTMNFWIQTKKDKLIEAMSKIDLVVINDAEVRQLTGEYSILTAAKKILSYGPKILIIKRGEYGVLLFHDNHIFSLPAFPLEVVKDPTGAGDSFAGGFMGYLAKCGEINHANLRKAVVMGTVMASINVEDFSLTRLKQITENDISDRLDKFKKILHFEEIY